MLTRDDYFTGQGGAHRGVDLVAAYPADWNDQIEEQAQMTMRRVNQLLSTFDVRRKLTSGWRPPAINAATPGAAQFSRHMTGQAADIYDAEGDLDEWCLAHPDVLEAIGLWQEHPASTKGWCHVQIVPPKSGNRVFYP